MQTGLRHRTVELSSIDTTILLLGILFAGQYFDRHDAAESEIRRLANAIYERADWNFFRADGRKPISMGWHPETGLIAANWVGYNEGMMANILALGAPVHAGPADLWEHWIAPYPRFWRGEGATRRLAFAPMFGHQYSQLFIDFRGILDAPMREAGFEYFENSRRATYANRAYCAANPMRWSGYSDRIWGLTGMRRTGRDEPCRSTASSEPSSATPHADRWASPMSATTEPWRRQQRSVRCLSRPRSSSPAAEALLADHGSRIFKEYGFLDSFNPSYTYLDVRSETGTVDAAQGWVANDYLGIDQGPILLQAANHRDDFVWRYMRQVPAIRRGLKRAGFTGGWLG
jgi:hypothetical protein